MPLYSYFTLFHYVKLFHSLIIFHCVTAITISCFMVAIGLIQIYCKEKTTTVVYAS